MAYCTYSDIQSLLKDVTFDTNTKVTTSEITDIISRKDVYIDSRLQDIYTVPITGSNSLGIIKDISIKLTGTEVWSRLHPSNLKEGETDWATRWKKEAMATLEQIVNGELELSDAGQLNIVEKNKTNLMDSGVANLSETDDGYNPVFQIGDTY